MKLKSKELSKLEKQRYSVFYKDLSECCLCGNKTQMTLHEIFAGKNRINSMKYGFILPLCLNCHQLIQNDAPFNKIWYIEAQNYFESHIGNRNEFIKIFKKSYK